MPPDAHPEPAPPPDPRRLLLATLVALAVAGLVLVTAVLPAEYGIDPTGVGRAAGFTRLAPSASGGVNAEQDVPEAVTPPTNGTTLHVYASSYPLRHATPLDLEDYLASGDTALVPVTVTEPNVTRVVARLDWLDANETAGARTRPDLFEVQVKAPNGDVGTAVLGRSDETSGGGRAEAELVWRAPPVPREVEAASPAAASAAFLANDPPDASAAGEWTVRVTLVEAGGAEPGGVALPDSASGATDAGNDYRLSVTVETYGLAVAEKPGTRIREDTTTFTLAPGEELEYKLLMALGRKVEYEWSTGGPEVYVDFHGEKAGDDSGAFTRHKNGDFREDSGTLVAPFDGRHGWFWRNTSPERVTITLHTKGAYDVLGVVT